MQPERIKILYIAGWGRSGTTIIENILGQVPGFFPVGEIRYVWDRGFMQNRLCSCGMPFRECDLWIKIVSEAFGSIENVDPHTLNALMEDQSRTLRIFSYLCQSPESIMQSPETQKYLENLKKLYMAILKVTKCKVIIDSSKFPIYGALLNTIPEFDVHFVHVIRDPRAVAYSWSKPKLLPGTTRYMKTIDPVESSLHWVVWNLVIEYIGKHKAKNYTRLLYEDFTDHPKETMLKILANMGESEHPFLPFIDNHTVELQSNHAVSGNPDRFKLGKVLITPDNRWEKDMRLSAKYLVTLITMLFFPRYGYKLSLGKNQLSSGSK